ncbi:PREDICTED: Na(+)/H(+) exchanger beta-like isoform X2 [Priapulus caudatus]|uniref:Sodium/hydrogen exchanger n=1 Tax=Priapulus caudatus TaxID=37621 RepID=A0ABM1EAS8_PRICU|nr:PREDICTED: Na(+)/H(+) exchanger beta-like isoform X2 [Priapulus caudatus]
MLRTTLLCCLALLVLGILTVGAKQHPSEKVPSENLPDEVEPSEKLGNITSGGTLLKQGELTHQNSEGIHVASWRWDHVKIPLTITLFLVVTAWCKIAFHQTPYLPTIIPESCMLVLVGTLVGIAIHIVLESGYSLHNRVFLDNFGTVLVYAVIGTLINIFTIGPALYLLMEAGAMGTLRMSFITCLAFSSLIAAVDPVAVLAIFQELGVNTMLYFLVFGESLLNDAVTVVMYNMMSSFLLMDTIDAGQIALGFASFFVVSLGGIGVGLVHGIVTALSTKYTKHTRAMEPMLMLGLAYMSYLVAELFHFSGIISILVCAVVQAEYANANISYKSQTAVQVVSKMLSSSSDVIIFLFLGVALVRTNHSWNTGFVMWTIFLCLLFRFFSIFLLTLIVNWFQAVKEIHFEDMFITSYGGLRGAVCFSLAASLAVPSEVKDLLLTTTFAVITFTVFIQGITIKPLVKLLRIQLADDKVTMAQEMNAALMDYLSSGMEEISGHIGKNRLRSIFDNINLKYMKPWLQNSPDSSTNHIMKVYQELVMNQHYATLATAKTAPKVHVDQELLGAESIIAGLLGIPGSARQSRRLSDVRPVSSRPSSRPSSRSGSFWGRPRSQTSVRPSSSRPYSTVSNKDPSVPDLWNVLHRNSRRNALELPRSMAFRNDYCDPLQDLQTRLRNRYQRVVDLPHVAYGNEMQEMRKRAQSEPWQGMGGVVEEEGDDFHSAAESPNENEDEVPKLRTDSKKRPRHMTIDIGTLRMEGNDFTSPETEDSIIALVAAHNKEEKQE